MRLVIVCALDGYRYYCNWCSFSCETEVELGAHIAAQHPMGR